MSPTPKPAIRSLKTPSGWPVPRSRTGTFLCRWPTVSAPSTTTPSSAPSSRGAANRQKRPARLALATVLQFAEGLSDRQAADAVRSRIDWKYVLGLELPILASTIPS